MIGAQALERFCRRFGVGLRADRRDKMTRRDVVRPLFERRLKKNIFRFFASVLRHFLASSEMHFH